MEKMFVNPGGENFIDDFMNRIGPTVGVPGAISLKNEAVIFAIKDMLVAKNVVTAEEFDEFLKKKFAEIEAALQNTPIPSPIRPNSQ